MLFKEKILLNTFSTITLGIQNSIHKQAPLQDLSTDDLHFCNLTPKPVFTQKCQARS